MKETLYLVNEGVVFRKDNTIVFMNRNGKNKIPVESISDICCHAEITIKSGALKLLSRKNIPVHYFTRRGFYFGSFYPKQYRISGSVLVEQVRCYLENKERLYIAREIIRGLKSNVLRLFDEYYKRENIRTLKREIERLKLDYDNIDSLRSQEGKIWDRTYTMLNIATKRFSLEKREKRPPSNEINAMISFGNTLLYGTVLTEIYNTQLNPAVSYLHEPSERRFSLSLDIADIFKPIIVLRTVLKLVNKGMIDRRHFDKRFNGCYLMDSGKKIFLREYDKKLKTTVYHRTLKRKVSYRWLIRLELYKLIKHIIGDKRYVSFKMWW